MISVLYNDYSNLNDLFDTIYLKNKSNYIYVSSKFSEKENYNKIINITNQDKIKELIQHTTKIIDQHYFNINSSQYYIEFHKYSVNGKTKAFFNFHKDDRGAVQYNTITCIYYLQKDETINGGDLEFKKEGTISIKSNMLVMFSGNLTHRPTTMNGIGIRKSIVIQFERLE